MIGTSAQNTTSTDAEDVGRNVETTFNALWDEVIASDPQTAKTVFVIGMVLVVIAICSAVFALRKGWMKAGIGLCFAVIPGFFLMFPKPVIVAFLGFFGFAFEFGARLIEFIASFSS